MGIMNFDMSSGGAKRVSDKFLPRDRSTKKVGFSGGFDFELTADGFFDLVFFDAVVFHERFE
jgi:hypothetical protein